MYCEAGRKKWSLSEQILIVSTNGCLPTRPDHTEAVTKVKVTR